MGNENKREKNKKDKMRKMIIPWDDKTDTSIKTVIGIDPDVEKNGVATLCIDNRRTMDITTHTFPELLEYLNVTRNRCRVEQKAVMVVIEAGWLNKSNWHLNGKDTKAVAAAKGNNAGRNHEVGRKIAEMCEYWDIPYTLMKPLRKCWKGKDGKITHEELTSFTPVKGRTNQEGRDAALLAWKYAGLPIRKKTNRDKF